MDAASHNRSIAVWNVPTALRCGETFTCTLGIKCSAGCRPGQWTIEIRDREGEAIASATPGSAPWPGTAALFHAQVQLTAPAAAGFYAWEAVAPAVAPEDDPAGGHAEARASFNVGTVPAPECGLTVLAVDRESRSPVPGAGVVVHPYRARTDARGVARIRLPKGAYRLFVSGGDYFPFRRDGEMTADETVTAELEADPGPSDAELWS